MKYTLLQLTQAVLSSMDSDEVVSILDTTESAQVVKVIRTVYFDIISRINLPEHYNLFQLAASDITTPTLMTLPTDVVNVSWIKYDKQTLDDPIVSFQDILPLPKEDFIQRMYSLRSDDDTVSSYPVTFDGNLFTFYYKTDKAPDFYTSFDDNTIIFDSINAEVDTFLTAGKTTCWGKKQIAWVESDNFTPDMDEEQFALLLNEAKALAFAELKQTPHAKAEASARRGWIHTEKTKNAIKLASDFDQLNYFGRK